MEAQTDRFHQLFQDHYEPKLPISIYSALIEFVGEETAFNLLCSYERGTVKMIDIAQLLPEKSLSVWLGQAQCQ